MSQTELDGSLEKKVAELEEKADCAERAQDVEGSVQRAEANIRDLADRLNQLDGEVTKLQFYVGVLTDVFDLERPADVDDALREARDAADISDDALLDAADDRKVRELTQTVDDTQSTLSNARGEVIEGIRDRQRHWEDEIESARDLNSIIGGGRSEFEEVLDEMKAFLDDSMWNTDKNPATLSARWDRLEKQWNENAGKHGWESFQQEHDLTDETIDRLRQFAEGGGPRLDELSVDTLRELKGVEDLASAIRLEIDTG